MVSDWMVNGNISEFVEQHPDANRIALVGFTLGFFPSASLKIKNPPAGRRC